MDVCNVCGTSIFYLKDSVLRLNSPILVTALWKLVLNFYGISYEQQHQLLICDNCMKTALGREFTGSDFRDCEISQYYIKHNNLDIVIPTNNDTSIFNLLW